ncbi:MAG: hypothetical protein HRT64_06610, partial [Erythrobacter sp.]|nr:hypothetical protein [Erythrobacter sp.]
LELTDELGLARGASIETILQAGWSVWGDALPDHLRGAFAFALFCPESGSIYGARDIFGLCPFYYSYAAGQLVIASTSRAVRSLLPVKATQNEQMLADFVNGVSLEKEQTFFEEIVRLPPAHLISFDGSKASARTYWAMGSVARDRSPPDAAEKFRSLFDRAVQNCISDSRPALLISGGLDSSSIASSMHTLEPQTRRDAAAMTFPETPNWSDKLYLEDICRSAELETLEVPSEAHNPLDDMSTWLTAMDGPYLPHGHSISFRLIPMLEQRGFDVILSGHGGDEIVSYGFGRLNELAMNGHWIQFWRESSAAAYLYNDGPGSRRRYLRRFSSHFLLVRIWRWLRSKLRPTSSLAEPEPSRLSETLARKFDAARYKTKVAATRRDHDERMLQEEVMSLPLQPQSLEVFAVCAKASGVQVRFPFYDRELFELCLSLSSDWKLRDGLSRYVLRAAMGEDLPNSIRTRVDKYDFGTHFIDGLISARDTVLELTDPAKEAFGHFLNLGMLQTVRDKFAKGQTRLGHLEATYLWRVAILGMWLDIADAPINKPKLHSLVRG